MSTPIRDGGDGKIYNAQTCYLNSSFEEERWNHYQSETKTAQSETEIANRSRALSITLFVAAILFLGTGVFGTVGAFASVNSLPSWMLSAVGTIGHGGNIGIMVGGFVIGSILAGVGLYSLSRKTNN